MLANRLNVDSLQDIFSAVNVTKAEAREVSDQQAIQSLIAKVGPAKVNDVVMLSIKSNQLRLMNQALEQAQSPPEQFNALHSRGQLFFMLGEYDNAMNSYEQAAEVKNIDE